MDLRQFLGLFRKWWWLMLLSTAIAGFCSWYVVKDQPPVYTTSTTLMIGQSYQKPDPTYSDFYTSEQLAQTYTELVRREKILKGTAEQLVAAGDATYAGEQWRSLRSQVSANLVPGTQLIEIRVTDTDRYRAKRIADALTAQLMELVQPKDTDEQRFMREQVKSLESKIPATQKEIERLESELAQTFSARQVQEIQSQIAGLRNQANAWQSTYAQYQALLGEGSANTLTPIEEAPVPSVPIGPNWTMQVVLAAAIGLMLALAAALLLEYLDDTVKSPDDVSKMTGLTTLGVITRITGNSPAERLIAARHPKSPISEAYRTMRTNLQFSSLDRPLRSLVVTSANPKEGKSTTLANLGVVMAQAGKSVVLVDSDLRRPVLHKIFQVPNKEGLTNVLLEETLYLNGQLQETGIENLRILTSGPLPPNPSELLGSKKMQRLLDELKEQADVVLFDTPPALAVTDAAVLASQTDGVLVVAEAGRTRRAAAKQALDNLKQVGATLMGVAMNRLSLRGLGRSYYYYYYYDSSEGKSRRRRKKQ
jgi:succinoglycan biosynthesis transport protein ExoP